MGLDMYLRAKKYVGGIRSEIPQDLQQAFKGAFELTKVYEVGYWRKFYPLHNLIVELCEAQEDNCYEMYLNDRVIGEVIDTLNNWIEKIETGTPYYEIDSEWVYLKDCFFTKEDAIEYIQRAINLFKKSLTLSADYDFYYYAWY